MALRVVRCRWGGLALSLSLALSLPLPLALSLSLALPLPLALSLSRSLAVALSLSRSPAGGVWREVAGRCWWWWWFGGGAAAAVAAVAPRCSVAAPVVAARGRAPWQLAAARYVATRAASELTNTLSHPVVDWKPASNEWPPLLRRAARFRYFLCASQNRGVTS